MFKLCCFIIGILIAIEVVAYPGVEKSPLGYAEFVANRIMEQADFSLQYMLQPIYPDAEVIDFESFPDTRNNVVAYALTTISAKKRQIETFDIGFSGLVKVWINDQMVFSGENNEQLNVVFSEKAYKLKHKFDTELKAGDNKVLIKYVIPENVRDRIIIIQSQNLGRYAFNNKEIKCSLKNYAPQISLTNWLILGLFSLKSASAEGLFGNVFEPENKIQLFKVYESDGINFSWNLPRININAYNDHGAKFIEWNYHVGGFMWGLQVLSGITGNSKYKIFSNDWCENMISIQPVVNYQTRKLQAVRSLNWSLTGRPMLDYTTAPTMPFIVRLNSEKNFKERHDYKQFVDTTIQYALKKQFRWTNGVFAREYTIEPSLWADDMFMGLPFLLQTSLYLEDKKAKTAIYNDVSKQVMEFAKLLKDEATGLYKQACYVNNHDIKIPFWSRGNGWVVWTLTEVLTYLPSSHPNYKVIMKLYKDHVNSLIKYQDVDGCWHNLIDVPQTVKESSGTAIFTLAIARGINKGWLERNKYLSCAEKGWSALKTFIDDEGNMHGVKGGTNFSPDPDDYAKTPVIESDTHGVFPFLFACVEMNKLLENKISK